MSTESNRKLVKITYFATRSIDVFLLFGLARAYHRRLKDFQNDPDVYRWRQDQQREWDRLSQTLALLGTMHSAILAISPRAPSLAFAVWLGGAALAVCGLFIVQYFSVNAFGITDKDLGTIVDSRHLLLALGMAMPILASCWSGVLFAIGVFDYVVESDMGGGMYRAIALLPIGCGLVGVLFTMFLGKRLVSEVESKYIANTAIHADKEKN